KVAFLPDRVKKIGSPDFDAHPLCHRTLRRDKSSCGDCRSRLRSRVSHRRRRPFLTRESGMIRSCFLWCKHVVYAVAVLALVVCLAEIGLRVYDSATAQVTRCELYDRGLVCKSWCLHDTLKPSRSFGVTDPDTGQRVGIAGNGMGLRGPEPVVPKPAGTYRILCLGDDTTFAQGVAESETFCALLQAELGGPNSPAPIEVINAGVPDY